VRGAPAIAIVGMLAMAEELKTCEFSCNDELISRLRQRMTYLVTSRPTAVNLSNAATEMMKLAEQHRTSCKTVAELKDV